MSDLIDRQDAIDAFYHIKCNLQMMDDSQTADKMMHGLRLAESAIQQLPSTERKTGRWIKDFYGNTICSECKTYRRDNRVGHIGWCNACGAKMEVEHE